MRFNTLRTAPPRTVPRRGRVNLFRTAFNRLILGEGISSFGTQLAIIAVPSFAVRVLGASPSEVAFIYAVQWLPPLLLSLHAGRLADSRWQLWIMVIADLLAAVATLLLGYLMWRRSLSFAGIYGLTALSALAGTFYALGSAALTPRLIDAAERARGNADLAAARAVADIAAQSSATKLITVATGALVVTLDGVSFVARAALVISIWPIARTACQRARRSGRNAVTLPGHTGLQILRSNPKLLKLLGCQSVMGAGGGLIIGLFLVYAYRDLRLLPWQVNVMLAIGQVFALLGAISFKRTAAAFGVPATGYCGLTAWILALWIIPVAHFGYSFPLLLAYEAIFSFASTACLISITTQRQNATPSEYQGRIASWSVGLGYAAMVFGALLAAGLGHLCTTRGAIAAGCAISTSALLLLIAPDRWYGLPQGEWSKAIRHDDGL
ncbi:MFS transporter [Sphingomonas oryzagri]